MSSTVPVPSKAALTALRGLVLGTSCTLALIAEDRRRRINSALNVIENGKKLKASKHYHGGGANLALNVDGDSESLPFPYEPTAKLTATTHRKWKDSTKKEFFSRSAEFGDGNSGPVEGAALPRANPGGSDIKSTAPSTEQTTQQKLNFIRRQPLIDRPTTSIPSLKREKPPEPVQFALASQTDLAQRIRQACKSKDEKALDEVLQLTVTAFDGSLTPDNTQRTWMQITATLCRTLQELGRVDDAARLLQRIVMQGPVDAADYFNHSPLEVIDVLLSPDIPAIPADRDEYIKNLDLAATLFLPTFIEKPALRQPEVVAIGRRLLERSFLVERFKFVEAVYQRCLANQGNNAWGLAEFFISQLHKTHNHQLAIRHFLRSYSKMSPPVESVHLVGNLIVEAVEVGHNFKAAQVLKALRSLCAGICQLRTQWPMKLLACHWKKHGSFAETTDVFNDLIDSGLKDLVPHSDCLYRIMIEIALEANEHAEAQSYFDLLISETPEFATDVRILGRFALAKARQGDWEGVRTDIESAGVSDKKASEYLGKVFVPILKVYVKSHNIAETEDLLRLYIDQLKVPVSRYMVALMANVYGAERDLESFLHWLEYCVGAGFEIDAAFANAILVNCRRRWGFSFMDLRRVFLNLRTLKPGCIGKVTEHFMASSAVADGGGPAARGRVVSLGVDPVKLARYGKCASVKEVVLAMREALACNRPKRAIKLYRRSLHLGMPFSPYALRLAVQGCLALEAGDSKMAHDLIQSAQAEGNDVSQALVYAMASRLRLVFADPQNPEKGQIMRDVQEVIEQFESKDIVLDESTLHQVAALCLYAGHHRGTLCYALKAAEASGRSDPCFNLMSFKLLLAAYAGLADVDGIRSIAAIGLTSSYREASGFLRQLKTVRMTLRSNLRSASSERAQILEALGILDRSIDQAKSFRVEFTRKQETLEDGVMEIMKRAASNADATLALDQLVSRDRPRSTTDRQVERHNLGVERPLAVTNPVDSMNRLQHRADANLGGEYINDSGLNFSDLDPVALPTGARRFEVKIRPRPSGPNTPALSRNQTEDALNSMLEKVRVEEKMRNDRRVSGAAGW